MDELYQDRLKLLHELILLFLSQKITQQTKRINQVHFPIILFDEFNIYFCNILLPIISPTNIIINLAPYIILYLVMQSQPDRQQQIKKQQAIIRQQRIKCFYACLNIQHTKYNRFYIPKPSNNIHGFHTHNPLFPTQPTHFPTSNQLPLNLQLMHSFKHSQKKPQQKLVHMHFLKDSNYIILGYDKQTDRGDINFISVNELKPKEFYYNKLATGVGGIQCFDNGRTILISDKKGTFFYIDTFKELNHTEIDLNKFETGLEVLDFSLGPAQNKIVCGLNDKKCVIFDIEKEKKSRRFVQLKSFDRHIYSVNSVDWHPYKSLVVSSSIQLNDTVKLWDPHSEELVHQTSLHKVIITKVLFHPQGNSYFSLGKDNVVTEYQLRKRGSVTTFNLEFEPTCMQVLKNNSILISDSGGYMSLFTSTGQLVTRFGGSSGVSLFAIDQTNSILVVGRERQHIFEVYCQKGCLRAKKE